MAAAVEKLEPETSDGIVFVVGHSQFVGNSRGELCLLETFREMSHRTILVANIDTYSQIEINVENLETNIKTRYEDALSLTDIQIADIAYKDKLSVLPRVNLSTAKSLGYDVARAEKYFEVHVLTSTDPWVFCERTWEFFDQEDKHKQKRHGTVLLLHLERGVPVFTPLYTGKREINSGVFTLTKSRLFRDIHKQYHLKNILLVDYGCTVCSGISDKCRKGLAEGVFGGKKRSKIKRTNSRRRKRRRNRTKRTV